MLMDFYLVSFYLKQQFLELEPLRNHLHFCFGSLYKWHVERQNQYVVVHFYLIKI